MMVNLVAYPKSSTSALTVYEQPNPELIIKPVINTIVLFVPGLGYTPPTPAEIAAAVWARVGRTLTA